LRINDGTYGAEAAVRGEPVVGPGCQFAGEGRALQEDVRRSLVGEEMISLDVDGS
jgi:hypothetical protein